MNWTQHEHPVAPWDTAGLPPRAMAERCIRHKHCAYRDDDPARCELCHATPEKCNGGHGGAPLGSWKRATGGGIAGSSHKTLKAGQYNDPREEEKHRLRVSEGLEDPSLQHITEGELAHV
jgi:hypothetical protein